MRCRLLIALLPATFIVGCVAPIEPPTADEPTAVVAADCAAAVFADDRWIGPAFTDKFNGRYWQGSRALDVWREGQKLFAGPAGGPGRQLQRTSDIAGDGAFRDGCGATYRFVLPPDGPGGYVTVREPNGAWDEWHRR